MCLTNSNAQSLPKEVIYRIDSLNEVIRNSSNDIQKGNAHVQIATYYLDFDPDSSLIRLELAERLFVNNGYREGMADCESNLGIIALNSGDLEKACNYFNRAIELYYREGILKGVIAGFFNIGAIYYYQGDMIRAVNLFYHALRISERIDDKENIFEALQNIATVLENQEELDKSLELRLSALDLAIEMDSQERVYKVVGSLGSVYRFKMQNLMKENGDQDSIVSYKTQSLQFYNQTYSKAKKWGNRKDEAKIANSIGLVHKAWGQYLEKQMAPEDSIKNAYTQAIEFFHRSLKINEELGNAQGATYANQYISDIYLKQGNLQLATKYAEESMRLARETGFVMNMKQSADQLYEIYKTVGKYQEALEMYVLSQQMLDSMTNVETEKAALKREFQYESEKKEQERKTLENQHEIQTLKLAQKNTIIYALILFFLLGGLIVLLLVRNRIFRHRQKSADLEQRLLRSQMNPHFVFNSLNSIQRMYVEGNTEYANDYMADFSKLLRRILDNSSKQLITLKEELDTLKVYLEMEKVRTNGTISYDIKVQDDIDLFNLKVPPLIIQPFVENAIWHAIIPAKRKGVISINISRKDAKTLLCTIRDNGVGFGNSSSRNTHSHTSKGIKISRERLGSEASVTIEDLEEGGTQVNLLISIVR